MPHSLPDQGGASYPRLLADIGGTNARFGWLAGPGAAVSRVQTLPVPDHAGPAEAAAVYLLALADQHGAGWHPPRRAAFAVATAVAGDRVVFTNSHWDFSLARVQHALALDSLQVLNDFEALALSLPRLGEQQLRRHAAPAPTLPRAGMLAVVGPGTGLGVGAVVATGQGWLALPGEGGHATLAPANALESELLGLLRRQHSHVSAERLLSGLGLPLLYRALGQVRGERPDAGAGVGVGVGVGISAEQVVAGALDGSDALAGRCIDLFCALLGGFAGNVALTLGARGGLFIGGGIVPRFADRFFASDFRQRFEAKGRFQAYLAAIPTALITDTLAALDGAALAMEQRVDAPPASPHR